MDALILVLIIGLMIASFVLERFPVDVTAILALAALLVFDLVTPAEAVSGFSNTAVVTVLMLFILSEALTQTGVVAGLGDRIIRASRGVHRRAAALLMVTTGSLSAFVTNTATVAVMMPISLRLARRFNIAPSKVLIPLSYAAIYGGTCTLIGTSTNILVASLGTSSGAATFSVFEFFKLGGLIFVIGVAYNLAIAPALLPDRPTLQSLTEKYRLDGYLTELQVPSSSDMVGSTLVEQRIGERFDVSVLEIQRGERRITTGLTDTLLEPGDVLIARGGVDEILSLREHCDLQLSDGHLDDGALEDEANVLVEVQLLPQSDLLYATVREIDFRRRFGCFVLALSRVGQQPRRLRLGDIELQPWDTLLVFGPETRMETLAEGRDFNLLQQHDRRLTRSRRWWIPVAVVVGVVAMAALGMVTILEGAIIGVAVVLATGTLRIRQAYQAVDWSVIFLLAALIPMGIALEQTGVAQDIADTIVGVGEGLGPWATVSLVILATSLLTEVITNASAAVLMVPIAVSISSALGVDAKPFLMAVAFGASMSFATPTGYQTNTMVYGPGGYRFTDYVKVGVPLNLMFWLLASALIPVFWPF